MINFANPNKMTNYIDDVSSASHALLIVIARGKSNFALPCFTAVKLLVERTSMLRHTQDFEKNYYVLFYYWLE